MLSDTNILMMMFDVNHEFSSNDSEQYKNGSPLAVVVIVLGDIIALT
jgi:hypothetical protein